MEYAEIFRKVQKNHNDLGDVYMQLARTVEKLNKLHKDQVRTIEELEFEVISQKIRIEILLKAQNEAGSSEVEDKDLNLQVSNVERCEENRVERNEIGNCNMLLEMDQTQPTPRSLNKGEKKNFVSDKKDSVTVGKEKSDIKVNSKFLKKTQPKIHDFLRVKPQVEQDKKGAKVERKVRVQTMIIVDENGFRSLSRKKSTN